MGIAQMVRNCHSLKSLEKEISKCKVRCANCHRIKTFLAEIIGNIKWACSFNGKTSVSKTEVPRSNRGGPASGTSIFSSILWKKNL